MMKPKDLAALRDKIDAMIPDEVSIMLSLTLRDGSDLDQSTSVATFSPIETALSLRGLLVIAREVEAKRSGDGHPVLLLLDLLIETIDAAVPGTKVKSAQTGGRPVAGSVH